MAEPLYDITIRHYLSAQVGTRIVEITQHDREEWAQTGDCVIYLHLDSGVTLEVRGDLTIDHPLEGRTTIGTGPCGDEETPCDG